MNFLRWLSSIRTLLVGGVVCLALGFGSGYYTSGKFRVAKEVRQVERGQKETAKNVVESAKANRAIEQKVANKTANVDSVKTAVERRMNRQQEKANEDVAKQQASGETVVCPAPVLDAGTVRLLNAAREGRAVDPAAGGDAALETPSQAAGR